MALNAQSPLDPHTILQAVRTYMVTFREIRCPFDVLMIAFRGPYSRGYGDVVGDPP